jgi:hypothetical protein
MPPKSKAQYPQGPEYLVSSGDEKDEDSNESNERIDKLEGTIEELKQDMKGMLNDMQTFMHGASDMLNQFKQPSEEEGRSPSGKVDKSPSGEADSLYRKYYERAKSTPKRSPKSGSSGLGKTLGGDESKRNTSGIKYTTSLGQPKESSIKDQYGPLANDKAKPDKESHKSWVLKIGAAFDPASVDEWKKVSLGKQHEVDVEAFIGSILRLLNTRDLGGLGWSAYNLGAFAKNVRRLRLDDEGDVEQGPFTSQMIDMASRWHGEQLMARIKASQHIPAKNAINEDKIGPDDRDFENVFGTLVKTLSGSTLGKEVRDMLALLEYKGTGNATKDLNAMSNLIDKAKRTGITLVDCVNFKVAGILYEDDPTAFGDISMAKDLRKGLDDDCAFATTLIEEYNGRQRHFDSVSNKNKAKANGGQISSADGEDTPKCDHCNGKHPTENCYHKDKAPCNQCGWKHRALKEGAKCDRTPKPGFDKTKSKSKSKNVCSICKQPVKGAKSKTDAASKCENPSCKGVVSALKQSFLDTANAQADKAKEEELDETEGEQDHCSISQAFLQDQSAGSLQYKDGLPVYNSYAPLEEQDNFSIRVQDTQGESGDNSTNDEKVEINHHSSNFDRGEEVPIASHQLPHLHRESVKLGNELADYAPIEYKPLLQPMRFIDVPKHMETGFNGDRCHFVEEVMHAGNHSLKLAEGLVIQHRAERPTYPKGGVDCVTGNPAIGQSPGLDCFDGGNHLCIRKANEANDTSLHCPSAFWPEAFNGGSSVSTLVPMQQVIATIVDDLADWVRSEPPKGANLMDSGAGLHAVPPDILYNTTEANMKCFGFNGSSSDSKVKGSFKVNIPNKSQVVPDGYGFKDLKETTLSMGALWQLGHSFKMTHNPPRLLWIPKQGEVIKMCVYRNRLFVDTEESSTVSAFDYALEVEQYSQEVSAFALDKDQGTKPWEHPQIVHRIFGCLSSGMLGEAARNDLIDNLPDVPYYRYLANCPHCARAKARLANRPKERKGSLETYPLGKIYCDVAHLVAVAANHTQQKLYYASFTDDCTKLSGEYDLFTQSELADNLIAFILEHRPYLLDSTAFEKKQLRIICDGDPEAFGEPFKTKMKDTLGYTVEPATPGVHEGNTRAEYAMKTSKARIRAMCDAHNINHRHSKIVLRLQSQIKNMSPCKGNENSMSPMQKASGRKPDYKLMLPPFVLVFFKKTVGGKAVPTPWSKFPGVPAIFLAYKSIYDLHSKVILSMESNRVIVTRLERQHARLNLEWTDILAYEKQAKPRREALEGILDTDKQLLDDLCLAREAARGEASDQGEALEGGEAPSEPSITPPSAPITLSDGAQGHIDPSLCDLCGTKLHKGYGPGRIRPNRDNLLKRRKLPYVGSGVVCVECRKWQDQQEKKGLCFDNETRLGKSPINKGVPLWTRVSSIANDDVDGAWTPWPNTTIATDTKLYYQIPFDHFKTSKEKSIAKEHGFEGIELRGAVRASWKYEREEYTHHYWDAQALLLEQNHTEGEFSVSCFVEDTSDDKDPEIYYLSSTNPDYSAAGLAKEPEPEREVKTMNDLKYLSKREKDLWMEAVRAEHQKAADKGSFKWISEKEQAELKSQGVPILRHVWVLKLKRDSEGNYTIRKARGCVDGSQQKKGIDYKETFAPTARLDTFYIICALACIHDWIIRQLDVVSAFLNAYLKDNVYMRAPQGINTPTRVCKLIRAVYGLKNSPRAWFLHFKSTLMDTWANTRPPDSSEWEQSDYDPCLFRVCVGTFWVFLLIYVDDILVVGSTAAAEIVCDFLKASFAMNDLGLIGDFLGLEVEHTRASDSPTGQATIRVHQERYVKEVIDRFGMSDAKGENNPGGTGDEFLLGPDDQSLPGEEINYPYRELVGSLIYMSTRSDIAYYVKNLAKFMQQPGEKAIRLGKRVLRYLKGNLKAGREFGVNKTNATTPEVQMRIDSLYNSKALYGYSDSSYTDEIEHGWSTFCYLIMLHGGAIKYKVFEYRRAVSSTVAAEYTCLSHLSEAIQGIANIVRFFDPPTQKHFEADYGQRNAITIISDEKPDGSNPIPLFGDNDGSIKGSKNPIMSETMRHIRQKLHILRDHYEHGETCAEYINTYDQLADSGTKGLTSFSQSGKNTHYGLFSQFMFMEGNCQTKAKALDAIAKAKARGAAAEGNLPDEQKQPLLQE